MCKCNYIGLLVVLGAQIHSAKSPQSLYMGGGEGDSIFNAFQQTCLAFLGHVDD